LVFLHFFDLSNADSIIVYRLIPENFNPVKDDTAKYQISIAIKENDIDDLLDMVQEYTIRYFDEYAHPTTGMARERSNNKQADIVTTGGTGFGIMALIAGVERNFLTRERAYTLIRKMVTFLNDAERFNGAWAHWYDGNSGKVYPFSKYDDGGDIVETAFLIQGLLTARAYFSDGTHDEQRLCNDITTLWEGVNWNWYTNNSDSLYWHWSKNYGFKMNHRIKGYDETLITYILAAASPTHPIKSSVYRSSYTSSPYFINGKYFYGIFLPLGMDFGGPLFFTHYSFLGLNPMGLTDTFANYFERNRAHVLIHHAYSIENPFNHKGYNNLVWGITSSDDPIHGYAGHAPYSPDENGTIAPTAAISSIIYAPELVIPTLKHYYYDMGHKIFGKYGFYDAFNLNMPQNQQVIHSYLAIDQGPIAVMIENYRSQLIWNLFMSNNEISIGLQKLGFYYDNNNSQP
jgi:hypothetical protein